MFKKARIFSFILLFLVFFCALAHAYSFIVYGDNQGNSEMLSQIITKINDEKDISFVVVVGDFVGYGRPEEYAAYKKKISKVKVPVYHAMGNHDAVKGGWRVFGQYFGPHYYSFLCENDQFIVLSNSFKEFFDKKQFNWLKDELTDSGARHKFVFMHKPTFDPSEIYEDHVMSGRAIAEELVRLFSKYKVDYVFAGHIHGYAKAVREGVNYIVTAGGGAKLYLPPNFGGFHHYVRINVDGDKITEQVVYL